MRAQQRYALETENALDDLRLRSEEQRRRTEAALTQLEEANAAAHQLAMVEVEQQTMQERVLFELVHSGLPNIAAAFKQTYGTVNYTQLSGAGDGDGGPMGSMATAFAQVMTVAKGFGLDPAKLGELRRAPAAPTPPRSKTDSE
jgi:hypothetical protein